MADPTNAGGQSETGNASTDKAPSGPSEEYKGLQREVSKRDKVIEELAARVKELEPKPSVEEELSRERAARQQLEGQLNIQKLKTANPELSDVIDVLAEQGTATPEVITAIKSKITGAPNTESSGLRNNPARPPQTESEKMEDILKNGKAFD
jgi:hypothetical protein